MRGGRGVQYGGRAFEMVCEHWNLRRHQRWCLSVEDHGSGIGVGMHFR